MHISSDDYSCFLAYEYDENSEKSFGQQAYDYFKFYKVKNIEERCWCEKLITANDNMARYMIESIVDELVFL